MQRYPDDNDERSLLLLELGLISGLLSWPIVFGELFHLLFYVLFVLYEPCLSAEGSLDLEVQFFKSARNGIVNTSSSVRRHSLAVIHQSKHTFS